MTDELAERKAQAPKKINDMQLPAGSDMHYYCHSCDHLVATRPEGWWRDADKPPKFCDWCKAHGYAS
jgi:hypothetical protein